MSDADDFVLEDDWLGSYYELAMQIGQREAVGADERLLSALESVWTSPSLEGCYLDRHVVRQPSLRIAPSDLTLDPTTVYGWANVPSGRIVCVTHIVREEGDTGTDWLDLCLPTGALGRSEPRLTYPIGGPESRSWREPLDAWFAQVAHEVGRQASFRVALIGEEVSGRTDILGQPSSRTVSLLKPSRDGVEWLPPAQW